MPSIKILSWNVKCFVSCTKYGGDTLTVLKSVMGDYDLIVVFEISKGDLGVSGLNKLRDTLNTLQGRQYVSLYSFSGPPTTKGLDRVGIIYDRTKIHAITGTARLPRTTTNGGRIPVYFNVQVSAGGPLWEFCAWHAPEPQDGGLIGSQWTWMKNNLQTSASGGQTAIFLGDFNADFNKNLLQLPPGIPATATRPATPGYTAQITHESTTLKPIDLGYFNQIEDRYTDHLYDNFIVRDDLKAGASSSVVNVLQLIQEADSTPIPPLSYKKIYQSIYDLSEFYTNRISDHLPVELEINLP